MERCCVPLCNGSNLKGYFNMPLIDPVTWRRWTNACPFLLNFSFNELKTAKICCKHFIHQQIASYGRLKPNAVPSLYLPPSEVVGTSKHPLKICSTEAKQIYRDEQQSSSIKIEKLKVRNNEVTSVEPLHLQPVDGSIKVSIKELINKTSEEQYLTDKAPSSKDKKLVIEPSINVAEFSLNPSSFIYVPSSPKLSNGNKLQEVDTDSKSLSSDDYQELVSEQEIPQISRTKRLNSNIEMSKLVTLDKQLLTIQPLTVLNDTNKNKYPESHQLEQQKSSIEQKDLEYLEEHNSEFKETLASNECKSRLKYICYTCLSEDRQLTKLADIKDCINNLLCLVSSSSEAYEELSSCVEEVYICWECKAFMNRLSRFKNKVCKAQQQLKDISHKKYKTLSNLSTYYNYNYIPAEKTSDETNLNSQDCQTPEELNSLPNEKENGKKDTGYIVDNNEHYLTIQMSACELSEDLQMRKLDRHFIAATHKCTTCIKTFNDEEELDKHISDYHKVPQHVMCYICETYVRSDWHKEHNDSHFVKYKCHQCYKDYYSSLEMLEHLYEVHKVKDTFEEIIRKKLDTMKELRVKPLVLYSSTGRTFCYICSRCNQCFVSKTEIDMRCEPCNKILESNIPKCGKCGEDSNCNGLDKNYSTGKKAAKERNKSEPNKHISKLEMPDVKERRVTFFGKLSCAKPDKKYLKDTTNHIIYDHGYAKSDYNRSSPPKFVTSNMDTFENNLQNVSDESHSPVECEEEYQDIVKSISGQDEIDTVEISDIENVQKTRFVMFNLSEFLKIPTNNSNCDITQHETDVTEQSDAAKEGTDETEIKTEVTESETKVTEEGMEDFLSDPNNPTYKIMMKYQAHYTVKKMTVTEMEESFEERKSVPKFANAKHKCELCIEIFDSHQKRQSHTMLLHVKPQTHIPHILCDICRVYIKERYINEHRNNHLLKFFCHYCDYVAYNVLVMWKHLKLEHTCKVYSHKEIFWVKRRNTLTNPGSCLLNVDIKANENTSLGYMCLQCDELFPTLDLKNEHNRLYHRKHKFKEQKIKCAKCSKSFRRIAKLKEHYDLKHKQPPVLSTCPVCKKEVANMRLHSVLHRTPPMSCVQCNKVYPHKKAYLNHLRYTTIHAGDKCLKFKCNFCDKRFRKKSVYEAHINFKHRGISQECSLCHKKLSSAAHVCIHMKNVQCKDYKQYLCPTCGIVCKNLTVLKDHELYHSGDHVTCSTCGLQFRKYSSLRNHNTSVHKNSGGKKNVIVEIIEQ